MITLKDAKKWSRMGIRATYGQAILMLAAQYDNLLAMTADLGFSSGLQRFMNEYPDRFLNVGIAEQNLIGVAAGLAKDGNIVFASSFSPFITMRCCEQIRMNMGYMNLNIKTVGLGSGLVMGHLGNSHYGLEDVSIMRSIPNITVVSPADCVEVIKTVRASADYDGPVYIRLTGGVNNPIVYQEDYDYDLFKADLLLEGKDILIVASGSMVYYSLEAAKILKEHGLESTVINMHTVKPLDTNILGKHIKEKKLLITVEEHNIIGGLGSAVAEYKTALQDVPPQLIIGLPDAYQKSADYDYLLDKYGLTADKIAEKILKKLGDK